MSTPFSGYRRILAATDFSPPATAALQRAVWIAQQNNSHLVLAHTVADLKRAVSKTSYRSRLEFLQGSEEHFQRELRRESDAKLEKAIVDFGAPGLEIRYETLLGEPHVELIHAVQQENYDLVVTGTRGRGTWSRLLLGSTARRLLRNCPCAVWIVRDQTTPPPTSIVVAVDMSEPSRAALQQAAWLGAQVGARVHVLHVVESNDIPAGLLDQLSSAAGTLRHQIERDATQGLEELISEASGATPFEQHLRWGAPAEEVVKLASEVGAGLIVLGTVGRSGMQGMLLGNTAESVLTHSECDVLAVKPAGFASPITPLEAQLHPGPSH